MWARLFLVSSLTFSEFQPCGRPRTSWRNHGARFGETIIVAKASAVPGSRSWGMRTARLQGEGR